MLIQPRKSLNKAFLKIKPNRSGIELFKQNLLLLLDSIKEKESEEFHKNLISDFLKNTYYSPNHFINTKEKNDLVIHNGKEAKSNVGVIIEAKSPSNKSEMLSQKNINCKAMQELVLYYLRERISHKNLDVKHLVVTNVNEWYIFDEHLFEKLFAQNKPFVKQFENFEASKKSTDVFYKEIAKPFIDTVLDKLEYTYFDLASYDKILRNDDKQDDTKLIVLYKLLSPEHLLKLSFANDSNSLDKNFYNELLHLIGLTETKEGGKKLIERPKAGHRNAGSLLENVINQLDSLDKLSRLPNVKQYGDTHEERLFTVGLELCITWVNRILFLKLLEAQLISYHKGDNSYAFLHKGLLHDYDNLNALFFMVLAKKPEDRNDRVKNPFAKVPYLNSSLFEPTELEHQTLFISGLEDDIPLSLLSGTVIKDVNGKKITGTHRAIDYFFDFLDAYDFASEGSEDIQEDNKTLINASVLGLIFEKINGYKDGSFYTPSFITMYMCKETIRRAVVQKFNETKGWNCEDFLELQNKDFTTQEANAIINSVKICDPAVGSGHFLVSALNEMIAIKHDLKVLTDRDGKRLKEYQIDIVNDELIVTDEDGIPFAYNPKSQESQRLQETLFHEKQTIIENCLFGVDINPNSVKICRLRLWIELLKNAYYKEEREKSQEARELETLPNIDINIKCGNSLISRFGLDADLKEALKKSNKSIADYKNAVKTYHNASSKEEKKAMEEFILSIKQNFSTEIRLNDPLKTKLQKLSGELYHRFTGTFLFEPETPYGQTEKQLEKQRKAEKEKLEKEIDKIEKHFDEVKNNKIYENAFEWRFEFPEVLNDDGDFVGFDVVIGNPPYGVNINRKINPEYSNFYNEIILGELETYIVFYYKGLKLLKNEYFLSYITPDSWLTNNGAKLFREWLCEKDLIDVFDYYKPFADAKDTRCHSVLIKNSVVKDSNLRVQQVLPSNPNEIYRNFIVQNSSLKEFTGNEWRLYLIPELRSLFKKIDDNSITLDEVYNIKYGLRTGDNNKYISSEITDYPIIAGADISSLYGIKWKEKYLKTIEGLPNSYFSESFTDKKIIIQYVRTNSLDLKARWIEAAYVEGNYIPLNSLSYIYDKNNDFELKYLIAILNSYLINIYYRSYYTDVNVKPAYLSKIPIFKISKKDQQPFIDKVDQILSLKKDNPAADTSALEREIDVMVYALYGLSEEEIEIVEGS